MSRFLDVIGCSVCEFMLVGSKLVVFFLVPFFASWSTCSLPSILACALTLYIVVGCVRFC